MLPSFETRFALLRMRAELNPRRLDLFVEKRDGIRNAGTRGAIAVDLVGVIREPE